MGIIHNRFVQALGRLSPALIPALLFVPVVLSPPLNHDVAAVLNFSERWLNGEQLYVDLIDVNPPLIYVLNLLPAFLEQVTPLDGVRALQLCLVLFGAYAWFLGVRVRVRQKEGITERALLDAMPALFLFCGGYDFGQREHLMAVATLPYVLAACRRAMGQRPRGAIAIGLLAGLCALYVVSNGEAPWKEFDYAESDAAGLADLLGEEARGERVLVLSPGIWPIFPALNYADAQMTLREMNLWLLEGAYQACLPNSHRYREIWEMGRPEFYMFRTVAEDFARAPPAAVVVDKEPGIPWCGEEFGFIAYFTRHPLFAEVWSHYQLAASWGRYQVFTRKD